MVLGLETALRLAHAREIARAPVFSGKKSGTPRSPINIADSELDTLIKRLFNLSHSDSTTERPLTPQTPTGRGTPTGGRSTPQIAIQTNGTGSPARGRSVMIAYHSFSSHANLLVQGPQTGSTGSTATQMDTSNANKGAGKVAGVPNGPESKGKEAAAVAAAEASLDPVMHLDISKRDSMKRLQERLFRIYISLSLQRRSQELSLPRRRPSRRKAPRRPLRVRRARGPRGKER
jgi:hypothetical protein